MKDTARKYLQAGLSVLPARADEKRPTIAWKAYQKKLPTAFEVAKWFNNGHAGLCLITGAISGNLELIDFDLAGELFDPWVKSIPADLFARLVVEQSQSGGRHVVYRCEAPICGNLKLAQRQVDGKITTLIETRGEGGLFLCAPTPGYELLQGDLAELPVITEAERDVLLMAAWQLNEFVPAVVDGPSPVAPSRTVPRPAGEGIAQRPGDDFNARGDARAILRAHGWELAAGGDNERWRRPGKAKGWSATFNGNVFYVFSSNAHPFEPNKGYSCFAVFTLLEHRGNYDAAARALGEQGFGSTSPSADVDITGIINQNQIAPPADEPLRQAPDPGPLSEDLLRVPGFVSEVMDYTLETSPYPNRILAFCGALALQAFLAGRKIRDEFDTRTNIYLLALADSGVGKNRPRQVNREILFQVGLTKCVGDKFASGEGIQDVLVSQPSMLFQTDEVDGVLRLITRAKDSRHESIPNTLLTLYTDSNSVVSLRVRAGQEHPDTVDQPNLCLLGTAVPKFFYESLSEQLLTNGFFSRLIVFEADERARGRRVRKTDIPPSIIAVADAWAKLEPGSGGNLQAFHPEPITVFGSPDAYEAVDEFWSMADDRHADAAKRKAETEKTLWSRATERLCKLALIYAASENHVKPRISLAAVQWARALVEWQTQRMLFMAETHVADSEFHAECQKFLNYLRRDGGMMQHKDALRCMHIKAKDFKEIADTLIQSEQIEALRPETMTKTVTYYRLK